MISNTRWPGQRYFEGGLSRACEEEVASELSHQGFEAGNFAEAVEEIVGHKRDIVPQGLFQGNGEWFRAFHNAPRGEGAGPNTSHMMDPIPEFRLGFSDTVSD